MRLSVVVSTFDSPEALGKVLQCLALQSRTPHEVVIADDGSGPSTQALVAQWRSQSQRFRAVHVWQENSGFRKSRILNQAVAAATGDYLVFCDGDCLLHPDFIADHMALAERGFWVQGKRAQIHQRFASIARAPDARGLTLWRRGWMWRSAYGMRWPWPMVWRQRHRLHERAMGSNIGVWRDDLVAVNGFNEAFVGWGAEDREFTWRLFFLGRRRKLVVGRALQFHLDHPPSSRQRIQDHGEILADVRARRISRCEHGLSQHLQDKSTVDAT